MMTLKLRLGSIMTLKREVVPPPAPALDVAVSLNQPASTIVRGGPFLYFSGLCAVDPETGKHVHGTTVSETRIILTNLQRMLEAAGSSMEKVVKVNVLLHSMLEAVPMNDVYANFFPDPPPARTVCGAKLPDGCKVIIECTALA
jgi:2-iminobutanoate/2-iminopropanoate deaminase